MKKFEWIILILLLILITLLLFFKERKVSCFTGTNTLFDLNEMTFIPLEIRTKLKDKVNDAFIPSLAGLMSRWWNSLSQADKDKLLLKIDTYFANAVSEIDKADLSVIIKSPAPNSPQ